LKMLVVILDGSTSVRVNGTKTKRKQRGAKK